ncbi:hypothetical protein DRN67_03595 [Candidatus Micrarchaeota archaeon]|nr:MAG: hypothetical protein DRN67_03595 [Candidatus Micrarchaeota archaeon]
MGSFLSFFEIIITGIMAKGLVRRLRKCERSFAKFACKQFNLLCDFINFSSFLVMYVALILLILWLLFRLLVK